MSRAKFMASSIKKETLHFSSWKPFDLIIKFLGGRKEQLYYTNYAIRKPQKPIKTSFMWKFINTYNMSWDLLNI